MFNAKNFGKSMNFLRGASWLLGLNLIKWYKS